MSILPNSVVFQLMLADSMLSRWFRSFVILIRKAWYIGISNLRIFFSIQISTSKCRISDCLGMPKVKMVILCCTLELELKVTDLQKWRRENTTGCNLICLRLGLCFLLCTVGILLLWALGTTTGYTNLSERKILQNFGKNMRKENLKDSMILLSKD